MKVTVPEMLANVKGSSGKCKWLVKTMVSMMSTGSEIMSDNVPDLATIEQLNLVSAYVSYLGDGTGEVNSNWPV